MATSTTTHAVTSFDPEEYLWKYRSYSASAPVDLIMKFKLDTLHEIFKNGQIKGERLLDIGSGPTVDTVFAASRWFREITLSDLWEDNLNVLKAWKAGKRKNDYLEVFNYMLMLDGNREEWKAANQRLSQQVTSIVRGDVCQKNFLSETEAEGVMFDAVILSLCQNPASFSRQEYVQAISNYTRYIKTGGHAIVIDCLGETFYGVGENRFRTNCFEKEELLSMYRESGYEILYWKSRDDLYDETAKTAGVTDLTGVFALVGRKL